MPAASVLYMIIPCYNEEEVLGETAVRLREKYQSLMAMSLPCMHSSRSCSPVLIWRTMPGIKTPSSPDS